jgi:hypothetical protein
MSQDDITNLIGELKELKIRELHLLTSLETALQNQSSRENPNPDPNVASYTAISPRSRHFTIGDRIIITNKVARIFNRPVNRGDRTGVVTGVGPKRIDFKTDNGTHTWRAPHNLRHISQDE